MTTCGATSRSGSNCRKSAGWGTSHVGTGRCRLHGGATPTHERRALLQEAERLVVTYGLPRDVPPAEALMEELHRTAGHVEWLGQVIHGMERDELVRGVTKVVVDADGRRTTEVRNEPSVWLKVYGDEREKLVKVAAACIACGVAERQVRLAEQEAQQLARVITAVLTDLGHDPADDEVRRVVRLRLLQGGRDGHEAG